MKRTDDPSIAADTLEAKRRLWIEAFRHARHDWMNDLQMILGYAQLRKYDKLKACVDILKRKMAEESRIAHLGSDSLVETLLTLRARPKKYIFELRIDEKFAMQPGSSAGQAAELAVPLLLDAFERAAARTPHGAANELTCSFIRETDDRFSVEFSYFGDYSPSILRGAVDDLRRSLSGSAPGSVLSIRFGERTADVKLRLLAAP